MDTKQTAILSMLAPEDKRPFSQCLAEFLDTTGGRDKIFRLFQYYAKFIIPFIKNKDQITKLAGFIEGFGALCGLTRKMLRLGRYVGVYRNIMARLNKSPNDKEFNDIIKSISDLSNAIYFLLDHILLVNRMNVFKLDPKFVSTVDFYSNAAWGLECFTNLVYDFIDYKKNENAIKKNMTHLGHIENNDSEEFRLLVWNTRKLKYEQFRKIIDMLRCLFDIPIIIHFMTSDKTVSNKVAGFCGVITSLIGCYQKWSK